MKEIEIPFGARDSELKGWEYTIPEGMEAEVKDGKIIVREKESEDERIRKAIIHYILYETKGNISDATEHVWVTWLEKQKEQKPAEWSDNDDQLIGFIFDLLNDLVWRKDWAMSKEECLERLKFLRPQPKEEGCAYITPNKEFFQWIYDRLVYVHKENPNVDYMRSFKERIDNSVFDQCHWKPSKEQIQALEYVVSSIPPNYLKEQEYMMTLIGQVIQQLKRLM